MIVLLVRWYVGNVHKRFFLLARSIVVDNIEKNTNIARKNCSRHHWRSDKVEKFRVNLKDLQVSALPDLLNLGCYLLYWKFFGQSVRLEDLVKEIPSSRKQEGL